MKKNKLNLLGILMVSLVALSSCDDPCSDVSCLNGGECLEGTCLCPDGYQGIDCGEIDSCYQVTCFNGGSCESGVCNCAAGYEGTDCSEAYNAKFSGSFLSGNDVCDSTILGQHTIVLTASTTDPSVFTIGGIFGNGVANTVNCTVSSSNTSDFTLDRQSFTDDVEGSGFEIVGSGSISADFATLTFDYQLYDMLNGGALWDNCVGNSFIRQ